MIIMINNLNRFSESNKEKLSNNTNYTQDTKKKVLSILLEKWLITYTDMSKIKNFNEVRVFLAKLLHEKKISKDLYIDIWVDSWVMKMWNYLVLKWYMDKNEINNLLIKQKIENKNRLLWEMIYEEKYINIEQLLLIVGKLWVMKLWEYMISKKIIDYTELKKLLASQKSNWETFWKTLVHAWMISQENLNIIFIDLWIEIKLNDLDITDNYNITNKSDVIINDPWKYKN
jgi:hypothetical protein